MASDKQKGDIFERMAKESRKQKAAEDHRAGAAAAPEQRADANTKLRAFKEILADRRSIRVYDKEPIPEGIMREVLQDATLAPTSSNLQTFELYWVRDSKKKQTLAEACLGQPAATTAGELVAVVARWDLWDRNRDLLLDLMRAGGKPLPQSVSNYYEKLIPKVMRRGPLGVFNLARRVGFTMIGLTRPIVRTPVSDADFRIYGHVQAALVAQTLMLSLAAHGYDSCPMGGFDEVRVKKLLKLPKFAEVTMVISAGVRKPEGLYGPRFRLAQEQLVHEI